VGDDERFSGVETSQLGAGNRFNGLAAGKTVETVPSTLSPQVETNQNKLGFSLRGKPDRLTHVKPQPPR